MRDASTSDFVNDDRAGPRENERKSPETFSREFFPHRDLHRRRLQADLVAPPLNLRPDFVANDPDLFEFCGLAALHLRRIGEAPMHSRRGAWENRTFLRAGLVAHRNDVGKELARYEHIEDSLGFLF